MSKGAVGVIPTLSVDDLAAASAFYTALRFEHEWSFPEDGPASHMGFSFGVVTIMLALDLDTGGAVARQNLYFVLGDLDDYHAELRRDLDAEVPAIVQADYGMRDFSITDPWGHLLTFGQESLDIT